MKLHIRRRSPTAELKNAALAAVESALGEERARKGEAWLDRGWAVATGVVIYSAGFGAYKASGRPRAAVVERRRRSWRTSRRRGGARGA